MPRNTAIKKIDPIFYINVKDGETVKCQKVEQTDPPPNIRINALMTSQNSCRIGHHPGQGTSHSVGNQTGVKRSAAGTNSQGKKTNYQVTRITLTLGL